jgi:membrane-associated phospholipid phosphatase
VSGDGRPARQRDRRWLLGAAVLFVVVAATWIAVASGRLGPRSVDGRLVTAAHRLVLREHWLRVAALAVTRLGAPLAVDALALVVTLGLSLRRRWRAAGFVAAVRLVTELATVEIKLGVHRARPVMSHAITHAHGYSFPSGHASGAASAYLPIAVLLAGSRPLVRRVAAGLAVTVCLLVAISRVVLGVHFASDVIAGLALGGALTCGGTWLILGERGDRHGDGSTTQRDHKTNPIR